ncbi:MAG: type IV pilus twitching motility protein PilT [Desulfobacterales bacterium]|nr:type IV pilus twitching motility protein PilT [Desulfobacterales bacterium]
MNDSDNDSDSLSKDTVENFTISEHAELIKVFKFGIKNNASDIHVAPNEPFMLRRLGRLQKVKGEKLTSDHCKKAIYELLSPLQQEQFEKDGQLDFAIHIEGVGRFRGSTMRHQKGISAAYRIIPPKIPTLDELGHPEVIKKILDNHQGLILVTGAAGQGKSTTLAAMIDYINTNRAHHILTIEDPIEFVHPLKKAVVNQRELGKNTLSYANSLKAALREDPDVIMVGELRDLETISMAISAAETGHLVLATLSSTNAPKTVDRIIDSYPPGEQNQIRAMFSESIKGIISQRLIPSKDNTKMVMGVEILIGTLPVANLIRENKVFQIRSTMQTGKKIGMKIMDDSILELLQNDFITYEDAVAFSDNPNIFKGFVKKDDEKNSEVKEPNPPPESKETAQKTKPFNPFKK